MKIKSTAEISIETLNDAIADNMEFDIIVQDNQNYPYGKKYNIFDMLRIKKEMQKFLSGCPAKDPNNPNSEKEIFAYIYTKLAYMVEYDELARDIRRDASKSFILYSRDYLQNASSLVGAMCEQSALCSGFAEALRNLLAEKGIEAKYVSGKKKSIGENNNSVSHAWNQVKLDGEWYNCDITHDRKYIITEKEELPCFLKSNHKFPNYLNYPLDITPRIEAATKNVSQVEQIQLINRYRRQVLNELNPVEDSNGKLGFVKSLLKKLGLKKESEPEEQQFE